MDMSSYRYLFMRHLVLFLMSHFDIMDTEKDETSEPIESPKIYISYEEQLLHPQ